MKKRIFWQLLTVITALGVTAACSAASAQDATNSDTDTSGAASGSTVDDEGAPTEGTLIDFSIGLLTFSNTVPVYIGLEEGFFEEEGLKVSLQEIQTGPALIAAAVSGDVDVSMANSVSVLQAISQGLPLQLLAPTSYSNSFGEQGKGQGVYVSADSDINGPEDLRGKTIGIISVGNVTDLAIKASLDQLHGIAPTEYELLGIPAADTANAIKSGHIDAGVLVEPFATSALHDGLKFVYDPDVGFGVPEQEFLASVWFTTAPTLEKNSEAIAQFTRAIKKANDFAETHPDVARRVLSEITSVDAALLDEITLPRFSSELHLEGIRNAADSMLTYGFLDEPVDISAIVAE